MGIKKKYLLFFFSFFSLILIIAIMSGIILDKDDNVHKYQNNQKINTNVDYMPRTSSVVVDKVYTFLFPTDTFSEVYSLERHYLYYIYIELVTPHNVSTMRIRIWDPDDKQYNIFEDEMFYEPEYGRDFEIPFGTVKTGDYRIEFYSLSNYNYNLHILIEKGPKCLFDKIDSQENTELLLYDVEDFMNGDSLNPSEEVDFKSDMMYKIFIGRVSAISILENNEIRIDCSLEDPNGVLFEIYENELLSDIHGINMFYFGTAIRGEYSFRLTVYCNVNYVNIGYAIFEDYQIAEGIEGDEKKEQTITLEDIAEDIKESTKSLPTEWMIGTLTFVCAITLFAIILLLNQKKSNPIKLNMREK